MANKIYSTNGLRVRFVITLDHPRKIKRVNTFYDLLPPTAYDYLHRIIRLYSPREHTTIKIPIANGIDRSLERARLELGKRYSTSQRNATVQLIHRKSRDGLKRIRDHGYDGWDLSLNEYFKTSFI